MTGAEKRGKSSKVRREEISKFNSNNVIHFCYIIKISKKGLSVYTI